MREQHDIVQELNKVLQLNDDDSRNTVGAVISDQVTHAFELKIQPTLLVEIRIAQFLSNRRLRGAL